MRTQRRKMLMRRPPLVRLLDNRRSRLPLFFFFIANFPSSAERLFLDRLSIAYGNSQVVLTSNEDIEKWIEERKKRYPTKARVEEKKAESKRTAEEAAVARKRASRKAKEKRRKEREKQLAREDLERRQKEKKERAAKNLAAFLEKKARQAREAEQGTIGNANGGQDVSENIAGPAKELPDASKKRKLEDGQDENDATLDDIAVEASTTTLSGHSSGADLEMSDGDTGESMSISSGASSDTSESESNSDRPEESPFRQKTPIRLPAPKRERKSKQICRQFRQSGNCSRGNQCRFIHDIPGPNEGGYKTRNVAIRERRKEIKKRKGIYQAVSVPAL
jgi:Nuclear fragile X mental retardation-interacting protein 1 (NUFIP1)/Zinc finger C-x8-C-x5-C-x3-H type (and similar)